MARKAFRTIKIEGISSKNLNSTLKKILKKEKSVIVYFQEDGDLRKRLITKEGMCTVAYKGQNYRKWSRFGTSCFFEEYIQENLKSKYERKMLAEFKKKFESRMTDSESNYIDGGTSGSISRYGNWDRRTDRYTYVGSRWQWNPPRLSSKKIIEKYGNVYSLKKTLDAMKEHDDDCYVQCLEIGYGKGFKKRLKVINKDFRLN